MAVEVWPSRGLWSKVLLIPVISCCGFLDLARILCRWPFQQVSEREIALCGQIVTTSDHLWACPVMTSSLENLYGKKHLTGVFKSWIFNLYYNWILNHVLKKFEHASFTVSYVSFTFCCKQCIDCWEGIHPFPFHATGRWVKSTEKKCCPMEEEGHPELWWRSFWSAEWSLLALWRHWWWTWIRGSARWLLPSPE